MATNISPSKRKNTLEAEVFAPQSIKSVHCISEKSWLVYFAQIIGILEHSLLLCAFLSKCRRASIDAVFSPLSIHLILESEIISDHCDELRIRRLSSTLLDGVAEVGVERIDVASVPCNFDGVSDRTLHAARSGGILFGNRRVEDLCHRVDDVRILDREHDGGAEILVAFDVGGDADLVDDLRDLGLHVWLFSLGCKPRAGKVHAPVLDEALNVVAEAGEVERL